MVARSPFRVDCLGVIVICLLSARLAAQDAHASVSYDLAAAFAQSLTAADSEAPVEFDDGRLPAALEPSVHLPASARLLGAVTIGRSTFVMATTPLAPDSILHAIAREYGAARWEGLSTARVVTAGNPSIGGFRPPPAPFPTIFCHDSIEVIATARHAEARLTSVRLRVNGGPNPCARIPNGARAAAAAPPRPRLPLPLLFNPPNTVPGIECFTAGSTTSTQAQLRTTMDLAALVEHYAGQLEAQGWTPATAQAPLIRKVWSRRDSSGVTETVALSIGVSPLAPMCREASLTVTTEHAR